MFGEGGLLADCALRIAPYVMSWEDGRQSDIAAITGRGELPVMTETEDKDEFHPLLMGAAAAMIHVG